VFVALPWWVLPTKEALDSLDFLVFNSYNSSGKWYCQVLIINYKTQSYDYY